MDDLELKLTSLLNDPAAMQRVEGLLRSLGAPEDAAPPEPPAPEPPAPEPPAPEPPAPAAPDLSGLLGLFSAPAESTPDAALLRALRPYLHGEREKRLDDAMKLMQLTQLLPLLRL